MAAQDGEIYFAPPAELITWVSHLLVWIRPDPYRPVQDAMKVTV